MPKVTQPLTLGICSWSVSIWREPELRQLLTRLGLSALHLEVNHIANLAKDQRDAVIGQWKASPLGISATMIGFAGEDYTTLDTIHRTGGYMPDDQFQERLALTVACGKVTQELGIPLMTTHAGFIPQKSEGAIFNTMIDRLRTVADALAPMGVTLCFETGQETAETLQAFLETLQRNNIGVNFDPANMILYGKGDPIAAVKRLIPWVRHMHAKDASQVKQADPSSWCGLEVPVGSGVAKVTDVVKEAYANGYRGSIAIEREAGSSREQDIATAVGILKPLLASL